MSAKHLCNYRDMVWNKNSTNTTKGGANFKHFMFWQVVNP